jgi:hypothetical protein
MNADERSRTSTSLSPQAPEACASANSATSAAKTYTNCFGRPVKIFLIHTNRAIAHHVRQHIEIRVANAVKGNDFSHFFGKNMARIEKT